MYLIVEGVDTAGKSTQIELLKKRLPNAHFTREPGGTKIGLEIRDMVLNGDIKSHKSELFLFLADRAEHYLRVIKPNRVVVSDRGFISGIAYALENSDNYDLDFLIELNRFALDGRLPDFVVLLETNRELISKRLREKNEDTIEKRGIEYLLRVQENMKKILIKLDIDHIIIDASKNIDKIENEIKGFIKC